MHSRPKAARKTALLHMPRASNCCRISARPYWSLANLKTFRFTQAQVDAMRVQLQRADLSDENRFHLHFAMGKALEDAGDYAASFEHYAHGNRMRRSMLRYAPEELTATSDAARRF